MTRRLVAGVEIPEGGDTVSISDKRLRITRDGVLFVIGVLGIAHETLVANAERPTLLILFAGMVGLPVFLNKDEKVQNKKDEEVKTDANEPG